MQYVPDDIKLTNDEHELCSRCGRRYPHVWIASDELWERVTGRSDGGGLMCMTCFDRQAEENGIVLYWECAEKVFPSFPNGKGRK